MKYFSIIADDLTGASDTAVKFCHNGYRAKVIIDYNDLKNSTKGNYVLSMNSDTRECSSDEAYKTVFNITKEIRKKGYTNIYKKIDSALRGNVGAERDAAMNALGIDLAFVVPAIPALGRTIEEGYLNISNDMKKKNIKQIISATSDKKIEIVKIGEIRKSKNEIFSLINKLYKDGVNIICFDTETEDDLKKLSETFKIISQNYILAGASGMASYLPLIWSDSEEDKNNAAMNLTLLVSGSYNRVNYEQMKSISKNKNTLIIYLDSDNIISKPNYEIEKTMDNLKEAFQINPNISLIGIGMLDKHEEPDMKESSSVLDLLGTLSKKIIQTYRFANIIATGGETAAHIFKCLGAKEIYLLDEIASGIPVGRLIGGECDQMTAATKSGAFGDPDVFQTILKYLKSD